MAIMHGPGGARGKRWHVSSVANLLARAKVLAEAQA
jgi:hypothetical protein